MAASVRMRGSTVFKSLYLNRTSCVACRECQNAAYTTTVVNSEGGQSSDLIKPRKPRAGISIPKKKKRDSLSILKALASTVGKDPTAPKYVFMDDPALVPPNNRVERRLLLSKASGRRAARFMVNEYRNTFDHDAAAPHVKVFQPFDTEYQFKDVSVDALKERISRREVNDAIEVYQRLEEEGMEVSSEVKLSFLELLCVFGCKDGLPKLMPEEKIVSKFENQDEESRDMVSMEIAEEVFHSLPEKTADAYNWIARGMAKVNLAKGYQHYQEMKKLNIPVYIGTYNQLINFLSMQNVNRLEEAKNYLTEMKSEGIAPNLETFHCLLRAIKSTPTKSYVSYVPSVLAEMKVLNIEPTLYTWTLVLQASTQENFDKQGKIDKKGKNIISDINEIMTYMRKRGIEKYRIDHPKGNFFKEAMKECRRYFDADTALRIYEFKEDMGYNYITTSSHDDQVMYEHLLFLVALTETPDKMMEVFNKENSYQKYISPRCIQVMFENIETFEAYEHLPQVWQDLNSIITAVFCRDGLLLEFLDVLASPKVKPELGNEFVHIAKKLFKFFEDCRDTKLNYGKVCEQVTKVFVNNSELDLAWESSMFIYQKGLPGFVSGDTLAKVLELSLMEKDATKIMSFCELPSEARDTITRRVGELVLQYKDNIQDCLDDFQIQEITDKFTVEQTL